MESIDVLEDTIGTDANDGTSAGAPRPGRVRGRLARLVIGAVLLSTLAGAFGLGAWLTLRVAARRSPEVTVPELTGMDHEQAAEKLRAAGLAPASEPATRAIDSAWVG